MGRKAMNRFKAALIHLSLSALVASLTFAIIYFVWFPGELFAASGPTLLGQYVLKNVVLIAAALVVASKALHGPVRSAR